MINILVLDRDPFYGKCVEKTLTQMKKDRIQYLGQVYTIKGLEETAEREDVGILVICDEFYQYPHLIRNRCRHIIVTSMDINYIAPLSDEVRCSLMIKPFVSDEFQRLVSSISDIIRRESSNRTGAVVGKMELIIQYIKTHINEEMTLENLSALVHYSPSYCSKCFKDYTGTNISDYIRDLRIKRAESLLRTTDYQIQEIADMVGISKINTFGTVFRSVHGISPSAFRDRYRIKTLQKDSRSGSADLVDRKFNKGGRMGRMKKSL